jgi:hypothetical protein
MPSAATVFSVVAIAALGVAAGAMLLNERKNR